MPSLPGEDVRCWTAPEGRPGARAQRMRGGISVEYVVVCAVLAMALGIGMLSDDSVLRQLLVAMRLSFSKLAYAFSLP